MKRFDSESTFERQLANLNNNSENWKNIESSRNGPLVELLKAQAESFNEASRYMEYCLGEKKWDTARNYTSIMHMASVLNKKARRKVSAKGYALVSHTDIEGKNRLANLGNAFVEINASSDYDDIEKASTATALQKSALVPWTNGTVYEIPKGTKFSSVNGLNFISTESSKIKTFNVAYSIIKKTPELYKKFVEEGEWAGYKYLLVPIVEGSLKTIGLGPSSGQPSQTTLLNTLNIEAADSAQTKDLLYVTIEDDRDENSEDKMTHWVEVENIADAPSDAKVFELRITEDHSGTLIIFGDGYNGAIPPQGKEITLHYLETKGGDGNLAQKYMLNDSIEAGYKIIDPRTNSEEAFLHVTNHLPVIGGKDLETKEQFKADAEKTYRKKSNVIFDANDLRDNTYKYTSIPLYLVNVKKSKEVKAVKENGFTRVYRPVYISALDAEGDQLTKFEQNNLIESLNKYIGENNLVYQLDLEFLPYKLLKVDVNTLIELDNSKDIVASQSDFVKDVENIVLYNNGLSAIEPGNNKLNVSSIDKMILDKYAKNISDIQTNFWLRSYSYDVKLYYKQKEFNTSSVDTTITRNELVEGIKSANVGNQEKFEVIVTMKLDLSVSNATLGGQSKIKTGILGCNIPMLFNIVPPTTDIDSKHFSFAFIDKASSSKLLSKTIEENAQTSRFTSDEGITQGTWCTDWYASKVNDEYVVNAKYDSAKVYLAQLKEPHTFSLTDQEAIISNNDISTLDSLIANQSSPTFVVDGMTFRMPSDDEVQVSLPLNEKTFATATAELASLSESLSSASSEIDLATVAVAITNALESYDFVVSAQMIDRTLLSSDEDALMYVSTSKASISR